MTQQAARITRRAFQSPDSVAHSLEPMSPVHSSGRARRLTLGLVVLALLGGVLAGLGSFTFGYGEGSSYLGNDPASCVNCHVMQDAFDSWQHSSHHAVATCNDCHLSHHPVGKWLTKADNGFFHSLVFTTGRYPDSLSVKPRNRRVTQSACIHCHGELLHGSHFVDASVECIHCHGAVGHGRR